MGGGAGVVVKVPHAGWRELRVGEGGFEIKDNQVDY